MRSNENTHLEVILSSFHQHECFVMQVILTLYRHTDSNTKLPLGGLLPTFFVAHNLYDNLCISGKVFS